jgi:flagellar motor switch protein FliN/FliY
MTSTEKQDALVLRTDSMLRELGFVYDIPLQIAVEVGRMRMKVRDLVRLAENAVLELKKPAGEPFDVCVNGVLIARGEVIVAEQSSAVRIVEVHKSGLMS